jgi:hypothetical protein
VILVRTDVSEEGIASKIKVKELTSYTTGSSETSVLTKAALRPVPEDCILHSHRRENLKSYIALTGWAL